ncbi:MAG: DUF1015 domain-containing protein [Chloroherpetonaceae bacterium]|nr:DUF1015 domain-containing protein [Chthonomonadaceae bacterium]MDW8207470.1 DUF1015 domain-containing protein [Chloroherpetonaceae bacterium]
MARIAAFQGVHFNPERVPLQDVIAPPYDVISPELQETLYARHPRNIIRLILSRAEMGDASTDDRYTRAATYLRENLSDGTLVQDDTPGFYEYIQRFAHPLAPEQVCERRALFVALRLEPYANGVVLPHEETHSRAKADRLLLMRATGANPEPIHGLYEDPGGVVAGSLTQARRGRAPLLHVRVPVEGAPGDEHVVYYHTDPCLIGELQEFFAPLRIWIADGHHRYETALNYQRERGAGDGQYPWDYLLIGLSAFQDPGLVVLPTHRLVRNVAAERLDALGALLEEHFDVRSVSVPEARAWIQQEVPGERRFVLVRPEHALALTLRDIAVMDTVAGATHCPAWRQLDVTILQFLVLDRALGISWETLAHTPDVAYTRDAEEAVQQVQSGVFQVACLLQSPTVTQVRDVAAAGDRMPQKSTFFYPKLWSGLILRLLS